MGRLVVLLSLALVTAACAAKQPTPTAVVANQDDTQLLTPATLVEVVRARFPAEIAAGTLEVDFGSEGVDVEIIDELKIMGIDTTAELAAIIPADYGTKGLGAAGTSNVAGMMRDLMIIHDVRKYFGEAWRNNWSASPDDFPAPEAYGVDVEVIREMGVFDEEDGGWDGDPCGNPCGDPFDDTD